MISTDLARRHGNDSHWKQIERYFSRDGPSVLARRWFLSSTRQMALPTLSIAGEMVRGQWKTEWAAVWPGILSEVSWV